MKKQPSAQQKKAARLILENLAADKPRAMRYILEDAGYGPSVQKNPLLVTGKETFKQLLDVALPDQKLLKIAQEGLEATKIHTSHTEPDREVPDFAVRHKYLVTGLQLQGKLSVEPEPPKQQINNFFYKPEITVKTKEYEEELKNLLTQ